MMRKCLLIILMALAYFPCAKAQVIDRDFFAQEESLNHAADSSLVQPEQLSEIYDSWSPASREIASYQYFKRLNNQMAFTFNVGLGVSLALSIGLYGFDNDGHLPREHTPAERCLMVGAVGWTVFSGIAFLVTSHQMSAMEKRNALNLAATENGLGLVIRL